jgi:hypothetical protein
MEKLIFISVVRKLQSGTADTSSLQLLPDGTIRVVGNLPHNCEIEPKTFEDRARLIQHLQLKKTA